MADVIAEAFVRVRPETSGFQREAQPGLFSAAKSLAIGIGAIFAAQKVFSFGKQAIEEAALTQKATENIKTQFKGSSASVLKFGEDAAKAFGISKQSSETFSSAIGLTGKNLGLTAAETARMDLGLQKLAGSVGLIKGIDPSSVFEKLQQALLGNTRGLKTLGISVDATREKQALLDSGIVKATVNQADVTKATLAYHAALKAASDAIGKYGKGTAEANLAENKAALAHQALGKAIAGTVPPLTAAQKAQGVYLVATKELPKFLDQARQHSGDLADEQQKLTAEWANAKEELGAQLLPTIQHLASVLLADLPSAIRTVKTTFHELGPEVSVAGSALRGVGTATGFAADHIREIGPLVLGTVAAWGSYRAVVAAAGVAQDIYAVSTRAVNTAQVLLTSGTSGLADAQQGVVATTEESIIAKANEAAATVALTAAQEAHQVALQAVTAAIVAEDAAATESAVTAATETGAVLTLAAAEQAEAASAAEAAAATEVFNSALLSNPIGLLAVGVSTAIGALIGYKALTGSSASSTDQMTQSFQDAKSAANQLTDALDSLTTGHIDLRQAQLDRQQTSQQLAKDEANLTSIIHAGKKGTDEYRTALQQVQQDEIDLARTGVELAHAHQEITTGTDKARASTQKFEKALLDQASAATASAKAANATRVFDEKLNGTFVQSKEKALEASQAAASYSASTEQLALHQVQLSRSLQKTHPDAARQQLDLAALALAALDLTQKLGHVPTKVQIDAFYKRNMAELIREAQQLGQAVNNLPNSKVIDISVLTRTSTNVNSRKASGGGIDAGTLSITGEAGPEISISSAGRQIISHSQSLSLFANLSRSIDGLAKQLSGNRTKTPAVGSGVNIQTAVFQTNAMSFDALRRDALDRAALRVRR